MVLKIIRFCSLALIYTAGLLVLAAGFSEGGEEQQPRSGEHEEVSAKEEKIAEAVSPSAEQEAEIAMIRHFLQESGEDANELDQISYEKRTVEIADGRMLDISISTYYYGEFMIVIGGLKGVEIIDPLKDMWHVDISYDVWPKDKKESRAWLPRLPAVERDGKQLYKW